MNLNHTRVPFWLYPLTGLLLVAGWPMSPLTFLLFFAWIPLLVLESRISCDGRFFWVSWLNIKAGALRKQIVCGPGIINGPAVLRSGAMSTEINLRYGNGRLRCAPMRA